MRYFEEILYLLNWKQIGRAAVSKEFASWIRKREQGRRPEQKDAGENREIGEALTDGKQGERFLTERGSSRLEDAAETAECWLLESGKRKKEPQELWEEERHRAFQSAKKSLEWLSGQEDVRICTIFDEEYPQQLNDLGNQRPPVLYMKGKNVSFQMLSEPMPAVIGGRWPCAQALEEGPSFAGRLAAGLKTGIISGLARGCDRMGHEAALDAGLFTAAVMPCGLDTIVPEIHADLAEEILKRSGCLLTEYAPGVPPAEYRYAERDRITAALSAASIVIECEKKSGTMQTVRAAVSLGRPVACWMPEDPAEGFQGNRRMIKELGVRPVCDQQSMDEFMNTAEREWKRKRTLRNEFGTVWNENSCEPDFIEEGEQLSFLTGTEFQSQ